MSAAACEICFRRPTISHARVSSLWCRPSNLRQLRCCHWEMVVRVEESVGIGDKVRSRLIFTNKRVNTSCARRNLYILAHKEREHNDEHGGKMGEQLWGSFEPVHHGH